MRFRLAIALIAVATCVNAAPGLARSGPSSSTRYQQSATQDFWDRVRDHGDPIGLAESWIEAARAIVTARHPVAEVAASTRPSSGTVRRYVHPHDVAFAGDLNGDHRSDVVDLAQTLRESDGGADLDHFDLTTYDGRSGQRLWTSRVTPPELQCVYDGCKYLYRVGFALRATVASGPGVELAVFTVINDGPQLAFDPYDPRTWSRWGFDFAIDLATVDRRGRQVWSRHVEGRLDVEGQLVTLDQVPIFQGTGHIESSKANDWLLTVSDGRLVDNSVTRANVGNALRPLGLNPYVPNGDLFTSQLVVIDGRTGKPRNVGEPTTGPAAVRDVAPVGDLSGDGRDDLIESHTAVRDDVYTNRNAGGDGIVAAIRSSDGSRLWQQLVTTGKPSRVSAAGDVNGDRRADVLVELVPTSADAMPEVVAVDGATGSALWQKPADSVLQIGDIRRDGRANVLLAAIDTAGKRVVHLGVYDAAGARLWTADVAVPGTGAANAVAALAYDAGDLDADGIADIDVNALTVRTVMSGNTSTTHVEVVKAGFVSARTGRLLPRAHGERAIYGSLDGNGDDGSTEYATGVVVRSGHTAKPLWQVDFGQRVQSAWAETDGTRGRCGNLLASAYFTTSNDYAVVLGMFDRSGKLLWTRTLGGVVKAKPRTTSKTYHCR